jgi:hypothetical protein
MYFDLGSHLRNITDEKVLYITTASSSVTITSTRSTTTSSATGTIGADSATTIIITSTRVAAMDSLWTTY